MAEKPKRTPLEVFARRLRATSKSLEVLQKDDWLGQFADLTSPVEQLKASASILRDYTRQHEDALAELDAQIAASNHITREPIAAKKIRLEADAASYLEREATRFARSLKHTAELITAELAVETEKHENGGVIPTGESGARREYREGLAKTDEFTKTPRHTKSVLMRQMDKWGDYITEYEDRPYKMLLPDSSLLFRLPRVPQEYQRPLVLLMASDFMETAAEDAMTFASHMRDGRRSRPSGHAGGGG